MNKIRICKYFKDKESRHLSIGSSKVLLELVGVAPEISPKVLSLFFKYKERTLSVDIQFKAGEDVILFFSEEVEGLDRLKKININELDNVLIMYLRGFIFKTDTSSLFDKLKWEE